MLNSDILNNPVIKEKLKIEIKMYLENNDSDEVTRPILWDALKAVVRGKIIAILSYEGEKIREQKLKMLEKQLEETTEGTCK